VAAEGRERDAALARLVAVVDEEAGHVSSVPRTARRDIGTGPCSPP
jgi:hypothetical protein